MKNFLSDQCKEIQENNRMGKARKLETRKLETPRKHFSRDGDNTGQKQYGPNKSRRY